MSDYRVDAATKEEWAERAMNAEAMLAEVMKALERFLEEIG